MFITTANVIYNYVNVIKRILKINRQFILDFLFFIFAIG